MLGKNSRNMLKHPFMRGKKLETSTEARNFRLLNFSHSWLKGFYYYIHLQLHIFIVVVLHNSGKNHPRLSHGLLFCVRFCV